MPERIQLRRTAGWRKPEGAVVVSRPSQWGNPYFVGAWDPEYLEAQAGRLNAEDPGALITSVARAVQVFARFRAPWLDLEPLRGRDLGCWCALDAACHADVLLELANREPAGTGRLFDDM